MNEPFVTKKKRKKERKLDLCVSLSIENIIFSC